MENLEFTNKKFRVTDHFLILAYHEILANNIFELQFRENFS